MLKKVHFMIKYNGQEPIRDSVDFDSDKGPVEEQFWDALPALSNCSRLVSANILGVASADDLTLELKS